MDLDEIIESITQFKITDWTDLTADRIKVIAISDGYINTTLRVEKVKSEDNNNRAGGGPRNILIKKYGGNIFNEQAKGLFRINSPMIQSLIFYEQSKRGWGPNLYGVMSNGRVEEYIDCHTLTGEEAFIPDISRDVAKAYARFHSLKLPIVQENFNMMTQLLPCVKEGKIQLAKFLENKNIEQSESLKCFRRLHEFPIEEEGKWINCILRKVKQRTVLCTMDPNYLNRLVRNQKPNDAEVCRVLIIDFDMTAYSGRGYDLGGHFVNRMFDAAAKETHVTGFPYPSKAERVTFLSSYLDESAKLLSDFDRTVLDSMDNLMLECDTNALVYIIAMLVTCLSLHSILDERPNMATFIDPSMTLYEDLKEQFCSKYPHLVDNKLETNSSGDN